MFLFSAFMAARNLRAGRGDRRGAWRLAMAILILAAAVWVCSAHWVVDISMITIFVTNAANWFMSAAMIWLLFIDRAIAHHACARDARAVDHGAAAAAGRRHDTATARVYFVDFGVADRKSTRLNS